MRALEAIGRRTDVATVGAGGAVPTDGFGCAEAVDGGQRPVDVIYALPGYLETIGLRLIRGRTLTSTDVSAGDVAVTSESAAAALFANHDPIGAAFKTRQGRQFTVVGVVNDVKRSLTRQLDPLAYVIPPPNTTRGMALVVRMRVRAPSTLVDLRREISRLAPGTAVTGVWWSDSISALTAYRNPRFQTLVLGTFATLALALTALGIFAVVGVAVAARMRELAVRVAIGASPQSLVRLVVQQSLMPVVVGLVLGLIATEWLKHVAEAQLYQVEVRDPITMGVAAVTVVSAALVAAYIPARRASRVDPAVILRAE